MGDEFEVEDISMLDYAEDLDIAPLDLMIVVCDASHFRTAAYQRCFLARLLHVGPTMASRSPH